MCACREQFFYGAIAGLGAAAVGAGAILATVGLWRYSRRQANRVQLAVCPLRTVHSQTHEHDHAHEHGHGHFQGHFGEDEGDKLHLKTFVTGQYAPPEELMIYPFIPRDLLEFHRKCADICIKHKQV